LIKNDAGKIDKVKQNNNKVKDVRAKKLPLQRSSTLPRQRRQKRGLMRG
jgi:hypothetical protein